MSKNTNDKNKFAERLRAARLAAGLSQPELSRRTKISSSALVAYESMDNHKNPPIDKAIIIARELNVSLDWLGGLSTAPAIDIPPDLSRECAIETIIALQDYIKEKYWDKRKENEK